VSYSLASGYLLERIANIEITAVVDLAVAVALLPPLKRTHFL
jgi:hypothetical protein